MSNGNLTERDKKDIKDRLTHPVISGVGKAYTEVYRYFKEQAKARARSPHSVIMKELIDVLDKEEKILELAEITLDLERFRDDPKRQMNLDDMFSLLERMEEFKQKRRGDEDIKGVIAEMLKEEIKKEGSSPLERFLERKRESGEKTREEGGKQVIDMDALSEEEVKQLGILAQRELEARKEMEEEKEAEPEKEEEGEEEKETEERETKEEKESEAITTVEVTEEEEKELEEKVEKEMEGEDKEKEEKEKDLKDKIISKAKSKSSSESEEKENEEKEEESIEDG